MQRFRDLTKELENKSISENLRLVSRIKKAKAKYISLHSAERAPLASRQLTAHLIMLNKNNNEVQHSNRLLTTKDQTVSQLADAIKHLASMKAPGPDLVIAEAF